jgi:hypothetical protein
MSYEEDYVARDDAIKLLGRLASDDDFRSRFEDDPGKGLTEYGIRPPDNIPPNLTLPPKRKFAELLVVLLQDDVAGLPHGQIILFVVHGAMPIVEGDAAG